MSNNFFTLSQEEQAALIKKASSQFDMPESVIEKDIWVCWLLEKIFALPVQMVFKGGTSLSKVFKLIHRFSEDCDITIDYRFFKPDLNLRNLSKSQLKKVGEQLKLQLQTYVLNIALPYLRDQALKAFSEKKFEITLSENGEQFRFYYPSIMSEMHDYLRDHVLIEFGVRNSTEPCERHVIQTYLEKVTGSDLHFPELMINTLSPIRTFFEKATLIHVECNRDRMIQTPERLSRHWYDLYMLNNSWVGETAFENAFILKNVIEHKKAFFNSSYANYDSCLLGKFRLIPDDFHLKNLKDDFRKMIRAGMFHESPPKFDEMVKTLFRLEQKINQHAWE